MRRWVLIAAMMLGLSVAADARAQADTQPAAAKGERAPRLLVGEGGWPAYRARVAADTRLAPIREWVLKSARERLDEPAPTDARPDGKRMSGSVHLLERTILFGQAYRLTGDRAYADRVITDVVAAAGWKDWNPVQFLDTAHLATATALTLDWLHDELTVQQRSELRKALIEKCLGPQEGHYFWAREDNWHQVCSTGVLMAAIAIQDEQPELSRRMIDKVRSMLYFGIRPYEPDGIPPEGPSYWHYGNTFSVIAFSAMQTALNIDPDEAMPNCFKKCGEVRVLLDGPSGAWFGYSDSSGSRCVEPALFFLARELKKPEILHGNWRIIDRFDEYLVEMKRNRDRLWLLPLSLLWADAPSDQPVAMPALPRIWTGGGMNPLALLRAGDDAFVGIKGGSASNPHGHMDAGTFVVDLAATRWAIDLGLEPYGNIEKVMGQRLWDSSQNSPRWSLVRLNSLYHNTLTLNGVNPRVDGKAHITRTGDQPWPFAVIDLSATYAGRAARVTRGVRLVDAQTFDVIDHIEGLIDQQRITWSWITDAKVEHVSATTLKLTKNGQDAWLVLASPAQAAFVVTVVDDEKKEYESPNPGVVAIRVVVDGTPQTIAVRLSTRPEPSALQEVDLSTWGK
jgi:oligo-alginate lyase